MPSRVSEKNMAIICEGQLDTIAFHRAGFECAVAPQGTSFTENQGRILRRYAGRIFLALDSDSAGQKAIRRDLEILLPMSFDIRVIRIPGGKDPDELFRNGGAEAVRRAVEGASIEPKTSPADKVSPTVGTSTNTMSPNWLCAKSVMPIKASPPSTRHHSWSLEYFRFAGTFIIFGI